jgi:hypothetical protein
MSVQRQIAETSKILEGVMSKPALELMCQILYDRGDFKTLTHLILTNKRVAGICQQYQFKLKSFPSVAKMSTYGEGPNFEVGKYAPEAFDKWRKNYVVNDLTVGGRLGHTILHMAAINGNLPLIEHLVQLEPKLIDLGNERGETPLMSAMIFDQLPAMQKLVELGANINTAVFDGYTPLWVALHPQYNRKGRGVPELKPEKFIPFLKQHGAIAPEPDLVANHLSV